MYKVSLFNKNKILFKATNKNYKNYLLIGGIINNISYTYKPMEIILFSTATCTLYDVFYILKKNKQNINNFYIKIKYKRSIIDPKIFLKINFTYFFYTNKIIKNIIKSSIKLSQNKYCSAVYMLEKSSKITFNIIIKN